MSAPLTDLTEHLDDVRAFCRRCSRDRHLADDAAQEAALTALLHATRLRDPTRIRGWLHKVALRRLADELRRRRPELPLLHEPLAPSDEPAERSPRALRLRRAVRKLPPFLRMPVRLHYLKGMPLRDVAVQLETTVNGVKARLYRARRILREEVGP